MFYQRVSTSAVRTTTSRQTRSYFLQVHWTLQRNDERDSCVGVACCVIKQEQKDDFGEISEKFLCLLAASELGEENMRVKLTKAHRWPEVKNYRAENQECKYWSSIPPRPPTLLHARHKHIYRNATVLLACLMMGKVQLISSSKPF